MKYIIATMDDAAPVVVGTVKSERKGRQDRQLAELQGIYAGAILTLSDDPPMLPLNHRANEAATAAFHNAEQRTQSKILTR